MADFKLSEVAKKAKLTMEAAREKLREAGAEAAEGDDTSVTVEQMRILGVDAQKMLDHRRERLAQMRQRHKQDDGREVVIGTRGKETPLTPVIKRSKEDLLKRKSDLNRGIQQLDVDRHGSRQKQEDAIPSEDVFVEQQTDSTPLDDSSTVTFVDAAPAPVLETIPPVQDVASLEEQPKEIEEPVANPSAPAVTAPSAPVTAPTSSAPSAPARTPRPAGPAGYVARKPDISGRGAGQSAPRGASSSKPARPGGSAYQRPAGTGQRPAGTGTGKGFERPSSTDARPDGRRTEIKKPRVEGAPKEEPKKAKVKTGGAFNLKDWNKTITEGISELDIEREVNTVPPETPPTETPVVAVASPRVQTRHERKPKRFKGERDLPPAKERPAAITVGESIVVSELAGIIGIKAAELVRKLLAMGTIVTLNQSIDADTAALLLIDYGVEVTKKVVSEEELLPKYEDKPEELKKRPPVVTIMGHVDHGKTSLLDAIRSTSIAEKEAGGITQHIGAYEVELDGRKITFLDTPGHEAFTSLRARGAQVTDIVILVVAANDGVMPQTKEAIDHAKAAGVCIVVAINKIDRPDANSERVRRQLSEYGILSEEWGGTHQFQEISAKKGTGIKELLELVLLEADMLELRGNPGRPACAVVIEAQLDKQRGPVATLLVKNGTLRKGDTFVVGSHYGKVRSLYDFRRAVVKEAGISMPVEVMGFSDVPESGDMLTVTDERTAKAVADLRAAGAKSARQYGSSALSLSDFFNKVKEGEIKELNIIIKADVQGSMEALKSSLVKLSNVEVKVNVVHDATGGITESDVVLAMASKAIIIGFNVRPDTNAKNLAEREKVSIELYSVIYKAIDDVKLAMEGMLTPETVEQVIGKVEIRQVFSVPKVGKIAGCYVTDGKVTRAANVRVVRDNVVVYDGKISSLKRFSDDAKEVASGYECGLSIERYQDIKEQDVLEIYELVQEKRTLEDVK